MYRTIVWGFLFSALIFFTSCGNNDGGNVVITSYDSGTIYISADESFKPVIDEEIKVYEAWRPKTRLIVNYKSEADCLKDFATDSITMIISTLGFTASERQFMIDTMEVSPLMRVTAYDAIAVIVNPQANDSLFTMDEIRDLMTGKDKRYTPAFDGLNATSTVRYMLDSVLKIDSLGAHVKAADNSTAVIDYIAKVKDAIGFIGVCWIGNSEDTLQLSFLEKVKVAYIESTDKPGAYIKPFQANIYTKRYPMVRNLVYVVKEKYRGLAHAFGDFLKSDRGQLIFRRAYLQPAERPFRVRRAAVKTGKPKT